MRKWIYEDTNGKSIIDSIIEKRIGKISEEEKKNFLNPKLREEKLLETDKALKIIKKALLKEEKIVVYGDYDCDGACSTSVMVNTLKRISTKPENITYYTNNRFVDGYGICINGVDELISQGCDLIITVDNGIAAIEAISYARQKGLTVVVTDHHEQSINGIPEADAVIDQKRHDDPYPFKGLCGAGVAWKVMKELVKEEEFNTKDNMEYVESLIDIVAMATVGDVVPLLDENRYIVKKGMEKIKNNPSPFFEVIKEVTGTTNINIGAQTIAFTFVPIVNAASRLLGDPALAIDCLIINREEMNEEKREEIKQKMLKLKAVNETRKEMTKEKMKVIERSLDLSQNIIIASAPNIGEGIVGLIAGKIKEKYNKPTIIFSEHGDKMTGSARSIPGLNVKELFDKVSSHILKYGGHEMAAGLTVEKSEFEAFRREVEKIGKEEVSKEMMTKKHIIDEVLCEKDVSIELIRGLEELEPFGEGFRPPLFKLEFDVKKVMYLGGDKDFRGKTILDFDKVKHVKLSTETFSIIIWNEAKRYYELGEPKKLKCLGIPSINLFKGMINIQFTVDNDNFIV
jgi:single-stranded-DNA-specific exonuclease